MGGVPDLFHPGAGCRVSPVQARQRPVSGLETSAVLPMRRGQLVVHAVRFDLMMKLTHVGDNLPGVGEHLIDHVVFKGVIVSLLALPPLGIGALLQVGVLLLQAGDKLIALAKRVLVALIFAQLQRAIEAGVRTTVERGLPLLGLRQWLAVPTLDLVEMVIVAIVAR